MKLTKKKFFFLFIILLKVDLLEEGKSEIEEINKVGSFELKPEDEKVALYNIKHLRKRGEH